LNSSTGKKNAGLYSLYSLSPSQSLLRIISQLTLMRTMR
jgi:hypothetical protein